jgi:hypothetical protein
VIQRRVSFPLLACFLAASLLAGCSATPTPGVTVMAAAPAAASSENNVQATLAQTQVTLQNFSATATTLRNFINAQQGLGEGAGEAFGKLAEAADAVQRLADFLERNPNALLTGKKAPR